MSEVRDAENVIPPRFECKRCGGDRRQCPRQYPALVKCEEPNEPMSAKSGAVPDVKEVWKFRLDHLSETFDMPEGARLLHVHEQDGAPCVWMEVNPSAKPERRRLLIVGTGHQYSPRYLYLGTAHCGSFVWHVFEVPV